MENIQILECSPQPARIAPETAGQRTVSFACAPQENPLFTVEYQYDCRAVYRPLDPEKVSPLQPDFDTQEQAPHIRFTPFIRALCKELSAGETNPLKLARKFYDYCTTVVTYAFMREYATLTQIPEYAGLGLKGGLRRTGAAVHHPVPVRGYPRPVAVGLVRHPLRRRLPRLGHFLCGPLRLALRRPLLRRVRLPVREQAGPRPLLRQPGPLPHGRQLPVPVGVRSPKAQLRADPTDNQRGEAEYPDRGLAREELEESWELVSWEEIP